MITCDCGCRYPCRHKPSRKREDSTHVHGNVRIIRIPKDPHWFGQPASDRRPYAAARDPSSSAHFYQTGICLARVVSAGKVPDALYFQRRALRDDAGPLRVQRLASSTRPLGRLLKAALFLSLNKP